MKEKELYFIALVPDEPLFSRVTDLKLHFKEKYESRRALNSPPHITLQMPFKWRKDRQNRIEDMLLQVASETSPFQISLKGFGFFEPRVVYVDVLESEPLNLLQKNIGKAVKEHLKLVSELGERPFRPHITVAFRDLKKPMYFKAKEEFQKAEFLADFDVADICLLRHNGKSWDVEQQFNLARK